MNRKFRLPMPIELAGLTSRMTRADAQEKAIAKLGKYYDEVQNDIDDAIEAHAEHLGELSHYRDAWVKKVESMVARPNGSGDEEKGSQTDGQQSAGRGQVISSETPKGDGT